MADEDESEIIIPEEPDSVDDSPSPEEQHERKEYATLAHGVLSPRHRKLAELFAQGLSNADVAKALGLSGSRVSVLKNNSYIAEEIRRIEERIYEDTVANRLKNLADPALSHLESVLKDRTNRVKSIEKTDVAKWIVEKVDGKAAQKIDLGASMLGGLLDRLDAMKSAGRSPEESAIDVTPRASLPEGQASTEAVQNSPVSDELKDWIDNF